MSNVHIDLTTLSAQRRIERLLQLVQPKVLLTAVGGRFISYVDESFRTSGRGRWPPLAMSTLALRAHGGDKPLQDTGRYKASFVKETDDQTYVEVGTNLKTPSGAALGPIHELGTGPFTIRAQRAKVLAAQTRAGAWLHFGKEVHHPGIPARPVLPSQAEGERLAKETLDAMLDRALGAEEE